MTDDAIILNEMQTWTKFDPDLIPTWSNLGQSLIQTLPKLYPNLIQF